MSEWQILHGDCRERLKDFPDACIDAVVTDPPYELGFMGKKWDNTGIAYNVDLWREVLRVLKPGGHMLAFGGTRTYHRMACAIEDAGFDIRDSLHWIYGSGFPKSLDVSKAIDKTLGKDRKIVGSRKVAIDRWTAEGRRQLEAGNVGSYDMPITTSAFVESEKWNGWGTALKPAHEPVVMARKPLIGTVAANVQEHGTGALNIDACRIDGKLEGDPNRFRKTDGGSFNAFSKAPPVVRAEGRWPANILLDEAAARELDEQSGTNKSGQPRSDRGGGGMFSPSTDGVPCGPQYGDSGGASRFFYVAKASRSEREAGLDETFPAISQQQQRENGGLAGLISKSGAEITGRKEGSAGLANPRAGAGRTAENIRNHHPTVKPIALMRYLVKLITPPGGVVLDPFTGSGTTGCAAVLEGFDFIGVEREAEYVAIIKARLEHWLFKSKVA